MIEYSIATREFRMRRFLNFLFLAVMLIASPLRAQHEGHNAGSGVAQASGLTMQAGSYRVGVSSEPTVIPVGSAKLRLRITDSSGQPVEGAIVRALVKMPTMNMGESEQTARAVAGEKGVYLVPANFAMAGDYVATIRISGAQGDATGTLALHTGQNTGAPSGGFSPGRVLAIVGALALLAFVVWRMRRLNQEIRWRAVFTPPILGGLAILAGMLILAVYAVNRWRRPGAMTPLEAQGMEMSLPAPPGSAAVELATVKVKPVQNRVRYSGQAVGYIEQDVNARVSGNVLWMPFYAGDRVRRGQLLARLDTSQIEPQIAQSRANERMAAEGTSVAQGEYSEALANTAQARANVAGKTGAVSEARNAARRAQAEANSKRAAIREAQSEAHKAQAGLREASSAIRGAQNAQTEAQSELLAAQEEQSGAQAEEDAARTQIADAQAQISAAQADLEYWQAEIARMRVLVQEGAVSHEEFQREQAQAQNAEAKVRQARALLSRVQAEVRGAQSRRRRAGAAIRGAQAKAAGARSALEGSRARMEQARADLVSAQSRVAQAAEDAQAAQAEAEAAQSRVSQAQAELEASFAGVRAAQAQVNTSRSRISQAQAGTEQARAAVAATTTTRGYAEVRALTDGLVTQRLIAPGTLVQPGQSLLKVAQINPIRLQANVAEADLERVRVGSLVQVRDQSGAGKGRVLVARVSSVAPSVDPQTRTGIVEAIVPNGDARFVPGEYVSLEIETGRSRSSLSIPSVAIQQRVAPSGGILSAQTAASVWLAEPAASGQFTVRPVPVQTGVSDGSDTEIVSGLRPGQRVVTQGYQNLRDGDTVTLPDEVLITASATEPAPTSTTSKESSTQSVSVSVTERGFEPANIPIKAGVATRLTFTRKTDATCATEVVFPDFKIKRALPINKPVLITFTPQKSGEIVFGCGMDMMLRGKVVAR